MPSVIENLVLVQTVNSILSGNYVKLRQITIREYDSMIENSVFNKDDNIELLNGVIVEQFAKIGDG